MRKKSGGLAQEAHLSPDREAQGGLLPRGLSAQVAHRRGFGACLAARLVGSGWGQVGVLRAPERRPESRAGAGSQGGWGPGVPGRKRRRSSLPVRESRAGRRARFAPRSAAAKIHPLYPPLFAAASLG